MYRFFVQSVLQIFNNRKIDGECMEKNNGSVGTMHGLSNADVINNKLIFVCNRKSKDGKETNREVCIEIDNQQNSICMKLLSVLKGVKTSGDETPEQVGTIIKQAINSRKYNAKIQFAPPNNSIVAISSCPPYQTVLSEGYIYSLSFLKRNNLISKPYNKEFGALSSVFGIETEVRYFADAQGIEMNAENEKMVRELYTNYSQGMIKSLINQYLSTDDRIDSLKTFETLILSSHFEHPDEYNNWQSCQNYFAC